MAGNIDYAPNFFGAGGMGTKIALMNNSSAQAVFMRLVEVDPGTFKKTYPTTKGAKSGSFEAIVPDKDVNGKTCLVKAYVSTDGKSTDADGDAPNPAESDTVVFNIIEVANGKSAKLKIPLAKSLGDPRVRIAEIFKVWYPAKYLFASGPVAPSDPTKKNIFSVSGGYNIAQNPANVQGTSCGDVLALGVLRSLLGYQGNIRGADVFNDSQKDSPQAFITPSKASGVLPKFGDAYVLFKLKDGATDTKDPSLYTDFAHTGFIDTAPSPYGQSATWTTWDGGGGMKSDGVQTAGSGSSPTQWIDVAGAPNGGFLLMSRSANGTGDPAGARMVKGWADLDVLMKFNRAAASGGGTGSP